LLLPLTATMGVKRRVSNSDGVGDVFVWGSNETGVLGLTTKAKQRKRPFPVALIDNTSPSGYDRLLPKCSHIAAGGVHSVAVTPTGSLYTWGVGDEGQLSRPVSQEDIEGHAKPVRVVMPTDAGAVVRIAASDAATFALDCEGVLYASGVFKDDSEYGLVPEEPGVRSKAMRRFFANEKTRVTEIAAGNAHVAFLAETVSRKGGKQAGKLEVYTAGTGARGQLGTVGERLGSRGGSDIKTQLTPRAVRLPKTAGAPVAVFAGGWHTFALTATGEVIGFGLNNWGQLGVPLAESKGHRTIHRTCAYQPLVIESLLNKGIVQMACGDHHTLALARSGEVFSFGRFVYGRLGRPVDVGIELRAGDAACPEPALVRFPATAGSIVRVAAGMSHSAAVDDKGTLFVWGSGDGYMLGRGDDEDDAETPVAVATTEAYAKHWDPAVQKVTEVTIGGMHVMVIARPGYEAS